MTVILRDMSEIPVIEAMVANNVDFLGMFKNAPDAKFSLDNGATWFSTGIPFPLFNGVFRTNLSDERADRIIGEILGKFQDMNLPMIWSVTPLSRPPDLGHRLEAHGLLHGGDSPSMAINLNVLSRDFYMPDGLSIRHVENSTDLISWCVTLAKIFQFPEFVSQALLRFLSIPGFDEHALLRNFMGFENGRLVAVSTVFYAGGVAGIYNVGILSEARRRGFGWAITMAPLVEARDLGYQVGVLQSTEMGFSLYSGLGFKEYCKFGRYFWMPEPAS